MTAARFSICIPNFNHSRYIRQTIDSVLAQTYKNYEIVIVDNNSTDNSWEIIQSYVKQHANIRAYKNNYNIGFAPNLQRVTEKAEGDFIILLSSDDVMYAHALETYHQVLEAQGEAQYHSIICSDVDNIDGQDQLKAIIHKKKNSFQLANLSKEAYANISSAGETEAMDTAVLFRHMLHVFDPIAHFLATVYPRKLWQAVEGYDPSYQYFPDFVFLLKICSLNPRFLWVHKSLFGYRTHENNQDGQLMKQKAIKVQLDGYSLSVNAPARFLEFAGISRSQLEKDFIRQICFNMSLVHLSKGDWLHAFKIHRFAMAAYPNHTLSSARFYIQSIILLLGPLGVWLLKLAKSIYKSR